MNYTSSVTAGSSKTLSLAANNKIALSQNSVNILSQPARAGGSRVSLHLILAVDPHVAERNAATRGGKRSTQAPAASGLGGGAMGDVRGAFGGASDGGSGSGSAEGLRILMQAHSPALSAK